MELEIGEYIRDKEGNITRLQNTLNLDRVVYLFLGEDGYQYSDNSILKHSKNIIDLIEVRRLCEWKKNSSNNRNNCK